MASTIASECCNIAYDLLTIFISIADVTTDIIVLIDFYNKERMTFFGISLTILILAQCSYSIEFAWKFRVDIRKWHQMCCALFCCLPFGTLVSFAIYFYSEETSCTCFRNLIQEYFGLHNDRLVFYSIINIKRFFWCLLMDLSFGLYNIPRTERL